ncbi:STAS domain-containing protein [Streptomyces fuscigenes]|uniref:STAS domain-containing protein n=1 Tax=Streptomyces fuscigenes TaxID=1528880 RepID=UPI001F449673|nr:STAS domain-containing protein [Streptomyces fuscigenes]MCF3963394.1 STAS domain-containing protein [Streptomyces fuscigenes]
MTLHPADAGLRIGITWQAPHSVVLALAGDLDYDTCDDLRYRITATLADHAQVTDLHLDCEGLEAVDSMGLAALLLAHRATTAREVRLHLDRRSPRLERLLSLTGTLEHLTGVRAEGDDRAAHPVPEA